MEWDKFSEGASVGFDNFMDVITGEKDFADAMKDVKDHFENQED